MRRILTVVFTFNRPRLLWNAVESIERHFPWGDRIVVDDGSDSTDATDLLEHIEELPNWRVEVKQRDDGVCYGGFYRNMDWALKYAAERDYDYCLFFEDDEQFVWRYDAYPEYLNKLFEVRPDCHQIQPLFMRRIHNWFGKAELIPSVRAYRTARGFTTTGIWNLDVVRKEGVPGVIFGAGDCLPHNSQLWLKKGYRLYFQVDPTVAILPWVDSQIDGASKREVMRFSNEKKPLLNDLTLAETNWLLARDPQTLPCQEYFYLSDKNCARPIWHQKGRLLSRYFQLSAETISWENNTGLRGNWVSVEGEMAIEPEPGHVNFRAANMETINPHSRNVPRNRIKRVLLSVIKLFVPTRIDVGDVLAIRPNWLIGYLRLSARLRYEQKKIRAALLGCVAERKAE